MIERTSLTAKYTATYLHMNGLYCRRMQLAMFLAIFLAILLENLQFLGGTDLFIMKKNYNDKKRIIINN